MAAVEFQPFVHGEAACRLLHSLIPQSVANHRRVGFRQTCASANFFKQIEGSEQMRDLSRARYGESGLWNLNGGHGSRVKSERYSPGRAEVWVARLLLWLTRLVGVRPFHGLNLRTSPINGRLGVVRPAVAIPDLHSKESPPAGITLKTLLGLLAVGVALVGCAIAPSRVTLYEGGDAVEIRHRHVDESFTRWQSVEVHAVDDKFTGPKHVGAVTVLKPGKRKLLVRMFFRPGITPVYEGFVTLSADLSPGSRLVLNGRVDGHTVVAWLESADDLKRVTEEVSAPWWTASPNGAPTPIFVPVR